VVLDASNMTQTDPQTRLAELRHRNQALLRGALTEGQQRYDEQTGLIRYDHPLGTGGHVAQESLEYAIALAETGGDVETIHRIVQSTLDAQDLDPKSATYGNWFWMSHFEQVYDANAVSFMVPNYWHLLARHRALLGEPLATRVLDALSPAGEALLAHRCQWAYSNIFIKNIACKIQIGHLLDDPRMRDLAFYDFTEWLSYTSRFGTPEFNSPTYTAVQIRALEAMLEVPVRDKAFHEQVRRVLRLFYTDLFLHYHPRSGLFAGTKSRHKELAGTRQMVHTLLYRQTGQPPIDGSLYDVNYVLTDYLADPQVVALARDKQLPLAIDAEAPHNHMKRRTWMTRDFALSSAGGGRYGGTDVLLEVIYGEDPHPGSTHFRGNPQIYELFSNQDRNMVVGAVRWRFWPKPDREPRRKPVNLTPMKVGWGPDYVDAKLAKVDLLLTLSYRRCQPMIHIDQRTWDGAPCEVKSSAAITVEAGGVRIGLRRTGRAGAILSWVDDAAVLRITCRRPGGDPWIATCPFLLLVESENESDGSAAFRAKLEQARLTASQRDDHQRVRCTFDGRALAVDVPMHPPYLLRAGSVALPEGRLRAAVENEPEMDLWSES
jgi:hypothetical protein